MLRESQFGGDLKLQVGQGVQARPRNNLWSGHTNCNPNKSLILVEKGTSFLNLKQETNENVCT